MPTHSKVGELSTIPAASGVDQRHLILRTVAVKTDARIPRYVERQRRKPRLKPLRKHPLVDLRVSKQDRQRMADPLVRIANHRIFQGGSGLIVACEGDPLHLAQAGAPLVHRNGHPALQEILPQTIISGYFPPEGWIGVIRGECVVLITHRPSVIQKITVNRGPRGTPPVRHFRR